MNDRIEAPRSKAAFEETDPSPEFDLKRRHEIVYTKCLGKVTIHDVGADAFERIALESDSDSNRMMRALLCAAAVGPKGERFTLEALAEFPARAFADRVALLRAAARVKGVAADEVEKA